MKTVRIGDHCIGDGNAPFFVAELGICHGGSVDIALDLAAAAIAAGAHCVKTETFQWQDLVFAPDATCSYVIDGQRVVEPLAEHMRRFGLTLEEHHRVKRLCDERGIPFMSTAHDAKAVDFLVRIGAAAIKIASPDIVHTPLLRRAAATRLPVFLDTGAALEPEVLAAVSILREAGQEEIVVNHNPAGHPALAEGHDLRIMLRLRERTGLPVGLADHYAGYEMLYAAAALGADALEKPVSFDRLAPEPERSWSVQAEDLPAVLENIRGVHAALGRPERTLTPAQREYRDMHRMALVAARDLKPGEPIGFDTVIFGRPRRGVGVEEWDRVAGRCLARAVARHSFIRHEDLE